MQSDLQAARLIANNEKCQWEPSQVVEWLGLVWNAKTGTICITENRIQNIIETLRTIFQKEFLVTARGLASLVGKIISASAVFGNISQLMTRYCSIEVAAAADWDTPFLLDQYCQRELQFWKVNALKLNSKTVSHYNSKHSNYIIYSDASGTGCGAHFDLNGERVCHKQWDVYEIHNSSTWRELTVIEFALNSFLPFIKGSYIKWFSDSQAACKIVSVGSMRADLHMIALRMFQFCVDNAIQLDIQWIPRSELARADFISRLIDIDDWQITASCFIELEKLWGKHSVDCFANYYNKKINRYFSRFWNPGCSGVDFFVQQLAGENCLAVPPVDLIIRTLHYLYACRATATLVVPFWPSAQFWPLIAREYRDCVVESRLFNGRTALVHGMNKNSLLGSQRFFGDVIAIRLNFNRMRELHTDAN